MKVIYVPVDAHHIDSYIDKHWYLAVSFEKDPPSTMCAIIAHRRKFSLVNTVVLWDKTHYGFFAFDAKCQEMIAFITSFRNWSYWSTDLHFMLTESSAKFLPDFMTGLRQFIAISALRKFYV